MMIQKLIFKLTLILTPFFTFGQFDNYQSFGQLDSLSRVYLRTNNLDSAVLVIEFGLEKFPEYDEKSTYILDFLYSRTNQDSSALKNWAYGLKKRYFFGLNNWNYESRFKNNSEFDSLAKIDKQIGDSLSNLTHVNYEIVLPSNYSVEKVYPALFVFHGNGRNLQKAKKVWTSNILKNKFIVVYLQSYIFMNQYNYKWVLKDDKTDKEFKEIYNMILERYNINKNQIVFSGMSAGGSIAIDYAFNQSIHVLGLVLNCPVIPQHINDNTIKQFIENNKRLGIITGEKDFALKNQKELIERINNQQGQSKFTEINGIGHSFAKNFPELLDEYLKWIIE